MSLAERSMSFSHDGWNADLAAEPQREYLDRKRDHVLRIAGQDAKSFHFGWAMKPLYYPQTVFWCWTGKRNRLLMWKPPLPFPTNSVIERKTALFYISLRKRNCCQLNSYPIQLYDTLQFQRSSNVTKVWVLLYVVFLVFVTHSQA